MLHDGHALVCMVVVMMNGRYQFAEWQSMLTWKWCSAAGTLPLYQSKSVYVFECVCVCTEPCIRLAMFILMLYIRRRAAASKPELV
jgi:hypothetical protein